MQQTEKEKETIMKESVRALLKKNIIFAAVAVLVMAGAMMLPGNIMTVRAEEQSVTYIDADGTEKSCTATVLTISENVSEIGNGNTEKWYVVNSDTQINVPIVLKGNVNIILMDGETVTFGDENHPITAQYCILSGYDNNDHSNTKYDLKIYGQSGGTGAMTMYCNSSYASINVEEFYQYGGKVTINNNHDTGIGLRTKGRVELNNSSLSVTSAGSGAINSEDLVSIADAKVTAKATGSSGCAIKSKYNISITNSEVTAEATGTGGCAIGSDYRITITDSKVTATGADTGIKTDTQSSEGTVTLSLSGADNFVKASKYVAKAVQVAAGKYLIDEGGNLYGGAAITTLTASDIAGKKLVPAYGVGIGNMSHGTVTASPKGFRKDTFDNLSNADKTVTLTITPEASYTLETLSVTGDTTGDTVQLSGSGNTRTFIMPGENVTVSATFVQPPVTYLDASGSEQTCTSYTALTGGESANLADGWYVVPKNKEVSYTGTLMLHGNVHLILENGAILNVGKSESMINGIGIENPYNLNDPNGKNLTVYGQSLDENTAGIVKVYNNGTTSSVYGGISLKNGTFTMNGGNVEIDSYGYGNGIYATNVVMNGGNLNVSSAEHSAIYTYYDITINGGSASVTGGSTSHGLRAENGSITINGGSVNATVKNPSSNAPSPAIMIAKGSESITIKGNVTANTGINATGGRITFGFKNATDSIKAAGYNGIVTIEDGKCLTVNGTNAYYGTLTSDQLNAIKNETLVPAYGVMIGTVTNGTVSASPAAFAIKNYANANKTVTLTVAPDANYTTGAVSYNDGSEHTITPGTGGYSFSMPAQNVTASATFLKSLNCDDITIDSTADQTYTGSAITPEVTVKDGETTLNKDTDYTLSYSNNINAADSTATNAPTITITGKGSYSGTRTVKFTIKQKPVTVGGIKAKNKAYDTTTTAELDCSGATFAGKVDGDRLSVTATGAFEDANAGKAKTVKISGLTLDGESKDNYVLAQSGYQTTTTATITRATPEVIAPTASATYMENLSNVTLNNPTGNLPGTWTWATDNGINPNETAVGAVGTHVFRAKFTPTDTANYCETTKDVTVTVGKAMPHLTIDNFSVPYGHPVSVKITCDSDGEVTYVFYKNDGKTKTNTEDGAETEGGAPKNAGTYDIKASVAETSNYLSNEQTLDDGCVISKAPNPAVLRSTVTVRRGSDYDLSGLVSDAKGTVSFTLNGSPAGYSLSGRTLTLDSNAADSCTITVTADGTVDGKSNYETFTGEITVNATNLDPQDSFGFADAAQEKTYGDGDFTVAATGAETGSNVTYSSSDSDVASVEAETGKVTIKKAGTATITATAGATDTYASAAASYKLTVNPKPVTISGITADDMDYNPATAHQGMTLNTAGAKIGGKVDGDVLTVEEAIGICEEADAGKNKTVTILRITLGGSSAGNYTLDLENSQQTTTINITKANIPDTAITAPTGKNGLVYTGLAQPLVVAGTAAGGEMRYALGTATTAPADNLYSASIPTAVNAGTYYVWYMVKGDRNHNDSSSNGPVTVTISKASDKTINADAVELQKGNNIQASVNIRGYVGTGAVISTSQVTPESVSGISITDISVSNDKNNLTFKVSSANGGNAIITVTLTSDNYTGVTLTIPVKVQDRVTEVKLEPASGVESSVQSVTASGLDDYTDTQSGESVKVVLEVKPESLSQGSTVKTKIDNSVKVIFKGVDEQDIRTEYLDISITKQVGDGAANPVGDVGRVLELAIKYDLSGKFNPVVIREHEGTVTAFTALNAQPSESNYQDGTFYIDEDQGIVYIYSRYFSTFSIASSTVNSHTVSFDSQGGSSVDPIIVADGGKIDPLPSSSMSGYSFEGWYSSTSESGTRLTTETVINGDVTYYARWKDNTTPPTPPAPTTYTVRFDLNGKVGTAPAAQSVKTGETAERPADPTAEGYSFTGWYNEKECRTKYDFAASVTEDITLYAGWESGDPVIIEEGSDWNLYEDASVHEYTIRGINVSGTVENSNAKSKAYYDAKISGSTITVKVTGDRKKAASNATLEFDLGKAGVVEYTLPVSYVKPSFKLSSTTATIRSGKEAVLKTTVLVKNADGVFEPYDMTDVKVSATGLGTVTKAADGSIEIRTKDAGNGKINIVKEAWDGAVPVSLTYTVKGSNKDVLSVDLGGLKTVMVNSNAKGQVLYYDVTMNGAVPAEGAVKIIDKKNTGLATISDDGKLVISYRDGVKNGTYTITLQAGETKTNVKVKVSGKALDKTITAKVQTKYDVVTRQAMVVVPKLNDISGTIENVSVAENGFSARLDVAGNIVIDYTGDKLNVKDLNIGTLTLTLKISGVEEPVKLALNKVKAKKTAPKVKVGVVTIPKDASVAEGKIIGTANIVSTYKESSGTYKTIKPVKAEIVGTPKDVSAKVNDSDMTEIDIYSISKKSVSFKVKLTYAGGMTKTVTVKVKKK